ncbi:MAG: hypothetical protein HY701_08865 [Gemmatimonadetes bacterium]|nr:hypothetical protein [Gemmatimonadota bacterium]
MWDLDALDLIEPAHLTFGPRGLGELRLIAIGAEIDYRVSDRDGMAFVEFSWEGYDESDPASGRGWAQLEAGGALKGRLFIHQGDESAFTAHREAEAQRPKGARSSKPSNFRLQRRRARRARR